MTFTLSTTLGHDPLFVLSAHLSLNQYLHAYSYGMFTPKVAIKQLPIISTLQFSKVHFFLSFFSLLAEKDKLERKVNIQGGDKKDD